jgi:dTDP-4-dehydrorhamnose 3,5-epimerase
LLKPFQVTKTPIEGVFLIEHQIYSDSRGELQRIFDSSLFADLTGNQLPQHSLLSKNTRAATLRGFHYQLAPYGESKIFTVYQGSLLDVVVDVRLGSVTYGKFYTVSLNAINSTSLLVPSGCANAWITEEPNTWLHYYNTNYYRPEFARGFRFDDPAFSIPWPTKPTTISLTDLNWPPFRWGVDGVT